MTTIDTASREGVVLAQNARVLFDSTDSIRIRTGIWNFEEAVVNYSTEPDVVVTTLRQAFECLAHGDQLNLDDVGVELAPRERANVLQLFSDLIQSGLLVDPATKTRDTVTMHALRGMLRDYDQNAPRTSDATPAVIVADHPDVQVEARRFADQLGMPIRPVGDSAFNVLKTSDLTTLIDTYATEAAFDELTAEFEGTGPILGLFQGPSLVILRNLNRTMERLERPFILGFMDGPFLSILGMRPPYTGCFECFELRSLSRLEDHIIYHEFARVLTPAVSHGTSAVMALITNLVVTEGFLEISVGASRFSGRVLNIFLPTLEIQVQDLLRMPGCPACGHITKQKLREINYNSRVVVDRLAKEALG